MDPPKFPGINLNHMNALASPGRTHQHKYNQPRPPLSTSQSHGPMAHTLRRKHLVCFYCNKKSDIKYDGLITRWDCRNCESTNYLDENGEITDPPVATDSAAPGLLKYATTAVPTTSSTHQDQLFCATCLKNQHLYTASLAQYHIETDPSHPQYKEMEREYFDYRKNLERLYPQVCEDCEPRVLEKLRDAGRTAKADHLRRALDRSRARRLGGKPDFYKSNTVEYLGRFLWHIGLAGQVVWGVMALFLPLTELTWLDSISTFSQADSPYPRQAPISIAWISLFFSLFSIWWNPMFKQMSQGFISHISGFGDWYKLQFFSLIVRCIYLNTIGYGVFVDPASPASIGANGFLVTFTATVTIMSYRSLKVDMTPLWTSTPEKLPHVGPKPTTSSQKSESMADVLDQIISTPSRSSKPYASSRALTKSVFDVLQGEGTYLDQNSPKFVASQSTEILARGTSDFSMLGLSGEEPAYHAGSRDAPSTPQSNYDASAAEEMEWAPTETQSQHRAFNSAQYSGRTSDSFSHAPVADQPSPFWYRVPPAPTTPAQRLRNPPNKPALRVTSQEVKENFFNRVTQRPTTSDVSNGMFSPIRKEKTGHGIEFAQQRFFQPPAPTEAGNTLADLLTGFSLDASESDTLVKAVENRPWKSRLFQSIVSLIGLLLWNQSVYRPSEYSPKIMLGVLSACVALGIRTIVVNTVSATRLQNSLSVNLAACLGVLECAIGVYGLVEVFAGRDEGDKIASLGTILTAEMFVHDLWIALMGS